MIVCAGGCGDHPQGPPGDHPQVIITPDHTDPRAPSPVSFVAFEVRFVVNVCGQKAVISYL